jgi:hypothetical protein
VRSRNYQGTLSYLGRIELALTPLSTAELNATTHAFRTMLFIDARQAPSTFSARAGTDELSDWEAKSDVVQHCPPAGVAVSASARVGLELKVMSVRSSSRGCESESSISDEVWGLQHKCESEP